MLDFGTGNGASLISWIEQLIHEESALDRDSGFTEVFIDETNLGVMLDFVCNYCIDGQRFIGLHLNKERNSIGYSSMFNYFDLITASHVFYYIPDWGSAIHSLLKALRPNGKMIIAQTSEQGFLYQFRKEFWPKIGIEELGATRPHSGEELLTSINKLLRNLKKFYVDEAIHSLLDPDVFAETRLYAQEITKRFIVQDLSRKGLSRDFINQFLFSKFGDADINIPDMEELELKQEIYELNMNALLDLITEDDFDDPYPITVETELIESETIITADNFGEVISFMLRKDFSSLSRELQKEIQDFIGKRSTYQDKGWILPFRDLGLIIKRNGSRMLSMGSPADFLDYGGITTRHVSAFLFNYLEQEIGSELIEYTRQKIRGFLKSKGLSDNELREVGVLGHQGMDARYDYLEAKGLTPKDIIQYDKLIDDGFSLPYDRLLYYDFLLLDLFLSNPYHARMMGHFVKDKTKLIPTIMQPVVFFEEYLRMKDMPLPSYDERRKTFFKCFEAMYYLSKNFFFSLKRVRDEYVIDTCKRIIRRTRSYQELLRDFQQVYQSLGHYKIVIPPNHRSIMIGANFSDLTLNPELEGLIIDQYKRTI